jgi:hypothetical protein
MGRKSNFEKKQEIVLEKLKSLKKNLNGKTHILISYFRYLSGFLRKTYSKLSTKGWCSNGFLIDIS